MWAAQKESCINAPPQVLGTKAQKGIVTGTGRQLETSGEEASGGRYTQIRRCAPTPHSLPDNFPHHTHWHPSPLSSQVILGKWEQVQEMGPGTLQLPTQPRTLQRLGSKRKQV